MYGGAIGKGFPTATVLNTRSEFAMLSDENIVSCSLLSIDTAFAIWEIRYIGTGPSAV